MRFAALPFDRSKRSEKGGAVDPSLRGGDTVGGFRVPFNTAIPAEGSPRVSRRLQEPI